jgi:hypothetical protein
MPADTVNALSAKAGERIGITLIDSHGNALDAPGARGAAKPGARGTVTTPRPARGSATPRSAARTRRAGRRR